MENALTKPVRAMPVTQESTVKLQPAVMSNANMGAVCQRLGYVIALALVTEERVANHWPIICAMMLEPVVESENAP